MASLALTLKTLEIPFRQAFSHSKATRTVTESLLVVAESANGLVGIGEGCPRRYVTGETIHTAREFFHMHRREWEQFNRLEDMQEWIAGNQVSIDANPAIWCAVELALLDHWGKEAGQSLEALLKLPELEGKFHYSAVLGTTSLEAHRKQAEQFASLGFTDFKIKLSGEMDLDRERIEVVNKLNIQYAAIRLDANNLWTDPSDVIDYIPKLNASFTAIEEPLQVGDYVGCQKVNQTLQVPIILDESFLRLNHFQELIGDPGTWVINIRISKMGGVLRSLAVADAARTNNIPIIIGAQVGETSILTRAALTVANRYRDILLAQEGAFGTYLLECDITEKPLMFGKEGLLFAESLSTKSGHGIVVHNL